MQTQLDFSKESDFSEESFLPSNSNNDAYSLVKEWPKWEGNVLFLYGPESSGKTHLANIWQSMSDAEILSRNFSVKEIAYGKNFIIDGIEDYEDEVEVFHLFNKVKDDGGYLLVTSKFSPENLDIALPDLLSRVRAILSMEIKKPDDELLIAVIMKHLSDRQLRVSKDVALFLLSRVDRSFDKIAYLIDLLDKKSMEEGREITIPFTKKVLNSI